ncbi:helix-turn-helix domain-containing protein [Clostridium botulinum]|nr:helix-turn-helix domain-containing protein [Clostridium botulinum]
MGYTIINNQLLEDERLNIQEQSLLITLISYYNKEKGYAYPSYKQLMKRSKIKSKTTFINTLNSLINNKYINRQTVKGKGCRYYINGVIQSTDIDRVQIYTKSKNVPTPSTDINQHQVQICTTTNTNTNTNTNTIYSSLGGELQINKTEQYTESSEGVKDIFKYWNEKKIIKHKKLTQIIIKAVEKSLKIYLLQDIKQAIDIYSEILNSDFYFNYKWSLSDFLTRKNGISTFMEEGTNKINYDVWKKGANKNGYTSGITFKDRGRFTEGTEEINYKPPAKRDTPNFTEEDYEKFGII